MSLALLAGGVGLSLVLLGQRRRRRAPGVIVTPPPDSPPPPEPPEPVGPVRNRGVSRRERARALLDELVADAPRLGRLVQLGPGQTLLGVIDEAFRAAGLVTFVRQREHYAHCMASGRFNSSTYGTPSVSRQFPKNLLAPGTGLGLRVAFLPRNEDAQHAMRSGRLPQMTVDARTGASLTGDKHYGLLWFPPVNEELVRSGHQPSCADLPWPDGSSSIDPPTELMLMLEES